MKYVLVQNRRAPLLKLFLLSALLNQQWRLAYALRILLCRVLKLPKRLQHKHDRQMFVLSAGDDI